VIEPLEKKKIYYAAFFPALISFFIVLVFLFEKGMGWDFTQGGVFPRTSNTILHVFTMPFVHSGWSHLLSNTLSFFVLSTCLYYFYSEIANKVLFLSVLFSGIILWVIGRDNWHIGASGVIFSLSFFLFFSGIIRKYAPLIAIALVVVMLYGNNVWHLFPWQKFDPVSWEGHLAGAVTGILLAIFYRKKGTQRPEQAWDDQDDENPEWMEDEPTENNENAENKEQTEQHYSLN